MNKTELAEIVAKKSGLSKAASLKAIDAVTDGIITELKKGGKVQLIGFGTFDTSKRAARTGINPQTGDQIKIKASKAVRFKAGKAFKDAVNKK
ncbi:MAG: HU family DNA-binding protein [Lachnospiraceae bacterium]|nr:HU family DNA-binding protein [Lachnospiraceae bacterium]